MRSLRGHFALWSCCLVCTGCLSAPTTRLPTLTTRGPDYERRESQVQDPYPDGKVGPEVGFRPPAFETQRAEPQRVRDRFFTGFLRQQSGPPAPVMPPGTTYVVPPTPIASPSPPAAVVPAYAY